MAKQEAVFAAIKDERKRQDKKWGKDRDLPPERWFTILGEKHGEVAKEVLEFPYTDDVGKLKGELTQVAAVAVAWLESLNERP